MAPLTPEELQVLEGTLLPALERHHLRLLAHGLRTLQAIAGRRSGPLPERAAIDAWARSQEVIRDDPAFAAAFLEQIAQLGATLERISGDPARSSVPASSGVGLAAANPEASSGPLGLDLDDLVRWSLRQADQRLEMPPHPP